MPQVDPARLARQRRRFRRGLLIMGILIAMGVAVFLLGDQLEALFARGPGGATADAGT